MRLLATSLCLCSLVACRDAAPRPDPHRAPAPSARPAKAHWGPRVVLIQLDGMASVWLERWLEERRFLPGQPPATAAQWRRGAFSRLARGARANGLRPTDPSLTAPNLVTMLTGAPPAVHGVLSNRFYRGGKRVSGFTAPITAELLWQAAVRQQRRVITWLAMGTRCAPPTPALRRSVCYPMGRVRRPTPAVTVRSGEALTLRAGRNAPGRPRLRVGVTLGPDGRVTLQLPQGARFQGVAAPLAPGDARAILWPGGLDAAGLPAPLRLSWVTLRSVDAKTGRVTFHDGGTSINIAAPPAFARTLEARGLIRPPFADTVGLRRGGLPPRLFARTAVREVAQVARYARWLGRGDRFDVALIYVAAVDELGHNLFAPAKRVELSDREVPRYHAALEWGLRRVDHHLGQLLDGLDLRRTRVVLASDHGMQPVSTDVSLRAALHPLDPRIRVVTGGASGYVHLPEGVTAAQAAAHLRKLRVDGRAVFGGTGRIVERPGFSALGLPPTAADLFVQAALPFSLSARRRAKLTGWPFNMATHGHRADLPTMAGVLLAAGPGLKRRGRLGPLTMTQVAALVAQAAGIRPPKQARPPAHRLWGQPPTTARAPASARP